MQKNIIYFSYLWTLPKEKRTRQEIIYSMDFFMENVPSSDFLGNWGSRCALAVTASEQEATIWQADIFNETHYVPQKEKQTHKQEDTSLVPLALETLESTRRDEFTHVYVGYTRIYTYLHTCTYVDK